jgi:cobyrinic acid a,c-diamide synthase
MAAFSRAGVRVAAAKVGPDFIDPGYHALATGRPGRNLDAWMSGETAIPALAARAAEGADLLLIEGVMGLFDGAADPTPGFASTAHVAKLLDSPVVLVVDASAMSGSVAALVHGFSTFDPDLDVAGVILNRVAGPGHEALLRQALGDVAVFGVVPRDDALAWRDRHLGLVPVVEQREVVAASIERLAVVIATGCDLPALDALARRATGLHATALPVPARTAKTVPVAIASGPAFSFSYPDNLEALAAAGAELVPFDPLTDAELPAGARALVAGGGFPEVFAHELAANTPLLADVRAKVGAGLVTWAECGGLLWLARSLDGAPMAGALDATAAMTGTLTLGYRRARVRRRCPLGEPGTPLRGHEFHYSQVAPAGEALHLAGRAGETRGGFATDTLLASYLHVHLAAEPDLTATFVAAAAGPGAAA